MDEIYKMTLPSIIGLIISTPLMVLVTMTTQDHTTMILVMLPMMGGAFISMIVGFRSSMKDFKRMKK